MQGTGVDGCRGGWLAVRISARGEPSFERREWLEQLSLGRRTVLIDIPIGLPEDVPRQCDRDARALLGRRRSSSVFPVPGRAAAYAASYPEACARNREQLGRSLSRQTWNIVPKIRETDEFIRRRTHGPRLRECHPELAFWSLNRGEAMAEGKTTAAGREQRRRLLEAHCPGFGAMMDAALDQYPRSQLAADDVLDAGALAVLARRPARELASLPARPPKDAAGLPMEIRYWPR